MLTPKRSNFGTRLQVARVLFSSHRPPTTRVSTLCSAHGYEMFLRKVKRSPACCVREKIEHAWNVFNGHWAARWWWSGAWRGGGGWLYESIIAIISHVFYYMALHCCRSRSCIQNMRNGNQPTGFASHIAIHGARTCMMPDNQQAAQDYPMIWRRRHRQWMCMMCARASVYNVSVANAILLFWIKWKYK